MSTTLNGIGAPAAGTITPLTRVYRPWTPGQVYSFVGSLTNVAEVNTYQFFVLAGDGAPTITAGFVKLNVIDRPQRKGFTVPAGYDPITLSVPVQFESWVSQPPGQSAIYSEDAAGNDGTVETDIQKLEWMAGRGKLYSAFFAGQVGAPATGDPPLVTVRSIDGSGRETNLIPPNLHGLDWIVASITYDTSPLRGPSGNRRRQAATVTLTEFVAAAGTGLDSPSTRAKARSTQASYGTYLTVGATSALNTIGKLTETYASNPTFQTKLAVLAFNKAKLNVKSVNQVLPAGTVVLIPSQFTVA